MDAVPEKTPPTWMMESLERSELQIAAGEIVPLDPVLDRIRARIARLQAAEDEPKQIREV